MNEFGRIADELTFLEMRVERMQDCTHSKALKAALQRAFVEACKASRALRLQEQGGASTPSSSRAQNGRKTSPRRPAVQKKLLSAALRSAEVGA